MLHLLYLDENKFHLTLFLAERYVFDQTKLLQAQLALLIKWTGKNDSKSKIADLNFPRVEVSLSASPPCVCLVERQVSM